MYALLGGDGATVTFVKYEDNKRRKDILHTFFAKSSVYNVQWLIQENVSRESLLTFTCANSHPRSKSFVVILVSTINAECRLI